MLVVFVEAGVKEVIVIAILLSGEFMIFPDIETVTDHVPHQHEAIEPGEYSAKHRGRLSFHSLFRFTYCEAAVSVDCGEIWFLVSRQLSL